MEAEMLLTHAGDPEYGMETRYGVLWARSVRELERKVRFVFGRRVRWTGRKLCQKAAT